MSSLDTVRAQVAVTVTVTAQYLLGSLAPLAREALQRLTTEIKTESDGPTENQSPTTTKFRKSSEEDLHYHS